MTMPQTMSFTPGSPSDSRQTAFGSIAELIVRSCDRFSGLPAYSHKGRTICFRELETMSRQLGAWLQARPDFERGARVALMLPNCLQYPIALAACMRAGLVAVNVNPTYTARELQHQLSDSGARWIIAAEACLSSIQKILPAAGLSTILLANASDLTDRALSGNDATSSPLHDIGNRVSGFRQALVEGAQLAWTESAPRPTDIALLQYTGGTTGISKGAILTHGNIIANLQQASAWYAKLLRPGAELVLTILPMYHIFALSFNCLLMIQWGAHNLLVENPRDASECMAAMESGFSIISGVNTLFNGLPKLSGFSAIDFSRLRLCVGGGAAIQASVAKDWQQSTGCPIIEGYGLTEASPFVLSNSLEGGAGSGLLPMPGTEVSIRDDEGNEVPPGEAGEICVRGPQVMKGYWSRPDETARAFFPGHQLRTGDIGVIDSRGAVSITDRKKDLVLVSGFNVFPTEVEEVLSQHPGVLESAVVGVPDPITGEAVRAFVVRRDDSVTAMQIIAFCRRLMTNYKVPKDVVFVDNLPKTSVGKILRRNLRSETSV
jgi:long-chain acyl-CoA synthetase